MTFAAVLSCVLTMTPTVSFLLVLKLIPIFVAVSFYRPVALMMRTSSTGRL